MGFACHRAKGLSVLIALCMGLSMASCRSALMMAPAPAADAAASWKSLLLDPFRTIDDEQFTRATSAVTLTNYRVKPATAAVGNRKLALEDCRGIALANNLELQVARMDEFTKKAIEYSNRTKMLPHFLFTGDLSQRDNYGYAFSDVLGQEGRNPNPAAPPPPGTGTGVTNYSVGHERSTWRYVLETRWSPTDAALAYYLSKSNSNDRLKAHYQRVRIAQKLVAVVDASYFRLLSLQEGLPLAEQLAASRSVVADKMKQAYKKRIAGVEEYGRASQNADRARRLLAKVRNDIERQRNILASAMAISPDYCIDGGFRVIGGLSAPYFHEPLCEMEIKAVQNRPEAFDAGLNHINSLNDLKRTIIKYFPKVSGFWRYSRDKDRFLYNKDWKEVGGAVYFDLLDWLANVSESRAARFNSVKTQREMGAVALGITSQVRAAALQYFDSMDELQSVQAVLGGAREVLRVAATRTAKDDLDRLALEEAKANVLQDMLERTRSLGEANASLAELQGAMGTNYNEPRPNE